MEYDLVVIGSGPGGYIAAIRASQLGLKTALIEKYKTLGGTCLNVGCIPSKALLDSSEHYHNALHKFPVHGINLKGMTIDFSAMMLRKNEVVAQMNSGTAYLMKKNKIDVFTGVGSFTDTKTIKVTSADKKESILNTKYTIIATGSKPASLPGLNLDKKRIISSTEALNLKEIPKSLIVIGGGVIGLELGSVYARLGTKVSVVEYMDSVIPTMDRALGKELQRTLKKLGFEFYMKHKVTGVENKGKKVVLKAENAKSENIELEAEYCLVAVGRKPYTEGLGLENAGIKTDEKGRIPVDEKLQTKTANIYAIGDVIAGPMLAHKAEEEGVFVAEVISGQKPHINYDLIPGVVYTWPEVASVGQTEEQIKEAGLPYKTGTFSYKANGRAVANMDNNGFAKVISHQETDEVLGVHIIGPRAADIIGEAAVAMEFRASAEDIGRICHAHPTFSEALKEAALDATDKRSLNS
ncbi:MAG: dihydrolipoyl dehydrogenase [Flavobacteriales bacterium]|nr:dihydrolipoyl dehydrogenase [Flavobacteriales bacterium]